MKFLSTNREISPLSDHSLTHKNNESSFKSSKRIENFQKFSQPFIRPVIKETHIEKLVKERANSIAYKQSNPKDKIPELKERIMKIKIEVDNEIIRKIAKGEQNKKRKGLNSSVCYIGNQSQTPIIIRNSRYNW